MKTAIKNSSAFDPSSKKRPTRADTMRQPLTDAQASPCHPVILQRTSTCACGGRCPRCTAVIQPKLTMGQPNDKYEQEADRAADQVMAMPDPTVQRQVEEDEEEEPIQTKLISDQITPLVQRQTEPDKEELQAKEQTGHTPQVVPNAAASIQSLRGGGQPLSDSERTYFEPRFGQDFSHVRIHADSSAAQMAKTIRAKAFTAGNDMVFGQGLYAPGTSNGRKLLAHELTHVIQQNCDTKRKSDSPDIMREVRGMVTRQRDGRNLTGAEWGVVGTALTDARSMVQRTTSFIRGIHNLLFPGSDPRLHTERELNATAMFRAHYKNPSPLDGLMAQEYFGYISSALNALNRSSFRLVTDEQANRESDGDTYAYVIGRDPTIYLAEAFFTELQQVEEPTTPGVHVTTGPRLLTASQKARLLIHETAHFRLGVTHSGGIFGFDIENRAGGLRIRNASQGLNNAYVYDHFAFCAS